MIGRFPIIFIGVRNGTRIGLELERLEVQVAFMSVLLTVLLNLAKQRKRGFFDAISVVITRIIVLCTDTLICIKNFGNSSEEIVE